MARNYTVALGLGLVLVLVLATFAAVRAAPAGPGGGATDGKSAAAASAGKKNTPPTPGKHRPRKKAAAPGPAGAHVISDAAPKITPFPTDGAAVAKAFAENRREQLAGVETIARAPAHDDRWNTVLFELRDFDSHSDPEACFWRVLAYYRLGDLARARSLRQGCALATPDRKILDGEETAAAGAPGGSANAAAADAKPYTGPQPTRWK